MKSEIVNIQKAGAKVFLIVGGDNPKEGGLSFSRLRSSRHWCRAVLRVRHNTPFSLSAARSIGYTWEAGQVLCPATTFAASCTKMSTPTRSHLAGWRAMTSPTLRARSVRSYAFENWRKWPTTKLTQCVWQRCFWAIDKNSTMMLKSKNQ